MERRQILILMDNMESASSINLFTTGETANDPVQSAKLTAASIASLAAARIESGDLSADLASQLQEISRQLAEAESQNRLTEAELAARAKAIEREARTLARLREDFERSRDDWQASHEQFIKSQRQWTQQIQKQDLLLQQRIEKLDACSLQLNSMPNASADGSTGAIVAPVVASKISHQREIQLEAMLRDAEDRENELLAENRELEQKLENLTKELEESLGKGFVRLVRDDYTAMAEELQAAHHDADRLRRQISQQDAEMEAIRRELITLQRTPGASDEAAVLAAVQSLSEEAEGQVAFDEEALRREILEQAEVEKESLKNELLQQAEAEKEAIRQQLLQQAEAEKEALRQQIEAESAQAQDTFKREFLEQASEGQEALKQQVLEQAQADQAQLRQQLEQTSTDRDAMQQQLQQAVAEQEALKQQLEQASVHQEALKQEFAEQAVQNQETLKQRIWEQASEEKEALQQKLQEQEAQHQQAVEEAEQRLKDLEAECAALSSQLQEAASLPQEGPLESGESSGSSSEEVAALEDKIDLLKRRHEMAMEDVKDLKAENKALKQQLDEASAQLGANKPVQDNTPHAPGEFLDWEEEKRRLMAMLESDFQENEQATPEQKEAAKADRMRVEDVIEQTDRVIQVKTQEIEELRGLLENQSSQVGNLAVGVGAFAEAFSHDELIEEERENLKRLQEDLHEKLKKAEVEISIERAKVARERAEIDEMLAKLGFTKENIREALEDKKKETAEKEQQHRSIDPSANKQTRWFDQMGIKEDENDG